MVVVKLIERENKETERERGGGGERYKEIQRETDSQRRE